jgi:hypothetical protein
MRVTPLLFAATVLAGHATAQTRLPLPSPYLSGYARRLAGEELVYHSPIPAVTRSLLVRSEDSTRAIAWESSPVPTDFTGDTAVFVLMAGLDVNEDRRAFTLTLDGRPVLTFHTPPTFADRYAWHGADGLRADFRVTLQDKYGDAMGYVFLHVPRGMLTPGRPLRFGVAGESAGRRTWFMVFMDAMTPRIDLRNAPAVLRAPDGERQTVRVDVLYLGDGGRLRMESPSGTADTTLSLGYTRLHLVVPAVAAPTEIPLTLTVDGRPVATGYTVEPVRRLELHLLHHTHLDIGYTHHQDEVERMHWRHLEDALRFGAASDTFPPEARFVWHPEGTWAVESYLATHGPAERERLLDGIRRGWIHLDALFANLLTGITTDEGLRHALDAGQRLATLTSVPIRSAMISDIPGFAWGLVPALAEGGVRYLSLGPNQGHRIGSFLSTWGDRPFWWEGPDGQGRVLTWVHGAGYSWFHTGLGYERISTILEEENVFRYLDQLTAGDYPYDLAALRYNIGSDNGPPDSTLSRAVRAWNARYASPRLAISSVSGLFAEFERRYGDRLPVVRGDLTGYWEDGAASSARETALLRRTAETLAQTERLAALRGVPLPAVTLAEAWRQVLLFYEHTWGSWNSVSEPGAALTRESWAWKAARADSAAVLAARLRTLALAGSSVPARSVDVINPSEWAREELVLVPAAPPTWGDGVLDDAGRRLPSQRLATGDLAFVAAVPARGSRRFRIVPGEAPRSTTRAEGMVLDNGVVRVELDPARGTIRSLRRAEAGREFVSPEGANAYVYVPGRNPADARPGGTAGVRITEAGPVVWTAVARMPAPGTRSGLEVTVRLAAGSDRIEIVNRFDKTLVYDPEAVLFRFPFALDSAVARISGPFAPYTAERDQPPGANRNYFSVERWVDLHDATGGVTVATIDAPMIQLGDLGTDAIVTGWWSGVHLGAVLYSYVMNNYWETNYRAGQDGPHAFRYVLRPHAGFDEAAADRLGREVGQPLVIVSADPDGEQEPRP